jgi:hypothetical protein
VIQTEQLPAPLVPAEVDLTDFVFMPLDVRRLRDSRFTATVDGEAFKVGLLLWCASWHQRPAASLPDDDTELAQLAGFGRVVREWRKVREDALYGWVPCNDGRLYHPTIAEKALESWRSKQQHAYSKLCDRFRKTNKARADSGLQPIVVPEFDAWISNGRADPVPPETLDASAGNPPQLPTEQPPPSTGNPAENALKGIEGTGKGQGQGLFGDCGSAPAPTPPTPPPDFTGSNAEALNGRAVVCIAKGFELPVDWGFDAEKLGFTPKSVVYESERFRQYWTEGKGKGTRRSVKNWRQSWSNWLSKAAGSQQR